MATHLNEDIQKYELERYVLELETDGLTVLSPEVTGITDDFIDRCCEVLLNRFTEKTGGYPITLEDGPKGNLNWPKPVVEDPDAPAPTQTQFQQLLKLDRCFRDLVVNPCVDALIDYLVGPDQNGSRARRLSRLLERA